MPTNKKLWFEKRTYILRQFEIVWKTDTVSLQSFQV